MVMRYRADKLMVDTQTETLTNTDTGNDNAPESQNWPWVKTFLIHLHVAIGNILNIPVNPTYMYVFTQW